MRLATLVAGCADVGYPGVYADVASISSWITGIIAGTDMNAAESSLGSNACPMRFSPGIPTQVTSNSTWTPDPSTFNNSDCDGTLFSDSYLTWVGDCYCDGTEAEWGLNLNCSQWSYDGGDCNPNSGNCSVLTPIIPTNNCTHFSCLDNVTCVDHYVIDYQWIGDNFCDIALDCPLYQNDGGDCDGVITSWDDDYFTNNATCSNYACAQYYGGTYCVDQYLDWDWPGDGYCDAALNCALYSFDGGDCGSGAWSNFTLDNNYTAPVGFIDQCVTNSFMMSCVQNPLTEVWQMTWTSFLGPSCSAYSAAG